MGIQSSGSSISTIVAIATAPGRSSVGVIRISGSHAIKIASQLHHQTLKPRRATLCDFLGSDGQAIDQGILIYYPKPASYTGEDVIELQGHGGRVIMDMLLARVIELGARLARPGEFTERAFHNNKLDLLQAEAIAALIDSTSSQAIRSAMRSLQGEFSDDVERVLQSLIKLRVGVESMLDFPEDDTDVLETGHICKTLEECLQSIEQINRRAGRGAMLSQGQQVVIIGSPNVGKSTLFNRLVGRDVAITSDIPGTTRDMLEHTILVAGASLSLIDTAGLVESTDDIERQGVQRAIQAIKQADIVLLVLDGVQQEADILRRELKDRHGICLDTYKAKLLVVRNKVDLAQQATELLAKNQQQQSVYLSAKTGQGVEDLIQRFASIIGLGDGGEDSYMARTRHLVALSNTRQCLLNSLQQLQQQGSLELVAEDLRQAQQMLSEITGNFVADDLLGEIFSTFCIGK